MTDIVDTRIKEWATASQRRYIDAVNEFGSSRKAARALGVSKTAINESIDRARRLAATKNYSPAHNMTHAVPDTHVADFSQYYDKDGQPGQVWVKARLDAKKYRLLADRLFAAIADEAPRLAPVPAPEVALDQLATVYTLTDSHVGMLAWRKEAGEDWDLRIAERVLTGCFQHMVNAAPASKLAIVNQLGDFLHQDGMAAVTPASGHNLDADGRFPKIVDVAISVLRRVVAMTLVKHEAVVLSLQEGNHDPVSSIWLRAVFRALFENEPRVRVLDTVLPYSAIQHGKTMLGFHHGHLSKNTQLPLLMAAQFPEIWGATTKRYVHTGHRHHVEEREHCGITVVQHPTIAARDAYAARGGWIAERQVTAITYHKQFGRVHTDTVVPEMLESLC